MKLLLLLVVLVICAPAAPASAGDWRWPLDGPPAVTRPFQAPAHRYAPGHRGADLPSTPGAPVRSAGAGRVSYAGLVAGRGVVVVVHGDLRTTYEPVTALVDLGSVVAAGEVVGTLEGGHLRCPVPACLHWGLRRGDHYLDPVRLVRPGPVRLLPLTGRPSGAALDADAVRADAVRADAVRAGSPGAVSVGAGAVGAGSVGAGAVGAGTARNGRLLAPGGARAPAPAVRRSTDVGLAVTAAASLLGAAAVGVSRRRRTAA